MFRLICMIMGFSIGQLALAECTIDQDRIGAHYTVTTKTQHGEQQGQINLWRNGNQVAHEYSDSRITEIWEQLNNGMLRMERHFDQHQRGIEYAPNEINHGKGERDWGLKYQLISDKLIKQMQTTGSSGEACDKVQHFVLAQAGRHIQLAWLPEQRLVKTYREQSADKEIVWQLTDVIQSKKQVAQVFTIRSHFYTTDYTDIGDNESDPFLLKMINLGHVEHGASGFYDAHGHALEGQHRH